MTTLYTQYQRRWNRRREDWSKLPANERREIEKDEDWEGEIVWEGGRSLLRWREEKSKTRSTGRERSTERERKIH